VILDESGNFTSDSFLKETGLYLLSLTGNNRLVLELRPGDTLRILLTTDQNFRMPWLQIGQQQPTWSSSLIRPSGTGKIYNSLQSSLITHQDDLDFAELFKEAGWIPQPIWKISVLLKTAYFRAALNSLTSLLILNQGIGTSPILTFHTDSVYFLKLWQFPWQGIPRQQACCFHHNRILQEQGIGIHEKVIRIKFRYLPAYHERKDYTFASISSRHTQPQAKPWNGRKSLFAGSVWSGRLPRNIPDGRSFRFLFEYRTTVPRDITRLLALLPESPIRHPCSSVQGTMICGPFLTSRKRRGYSFTGNLNSGHLTGRILPGSRRWPGAGRPWLLNSSGRFLPTRSTNGFSGLSIPTGNQHGLFWSRKAGMQPCSRKRKKKSGNLRLIHERIQLHSGELINSARELDYLLYGITIILWNPAYRKKAMQVVLGDWLTHFT